MVEHHLLELADTRVEIAGKRDVENQGKPVPPRPLNFDILLQRDDRFSGGRCTDNQVGLGKRLIEPVKGHRAAVPPRRGLRRARSPSRLVTRIAPGFNPFKCWSVSSPILPAPITSTVLSANESNTPLATSTATLATDSLPWSIPVRSRTSLPTLSAA